MPDPAPIPLEPLKPLLEAALHARASYFDGEHQNAFRLFNGFSEGNPNLVADLYATTLVLHNYAAPSPEGEPLIQEASAFFLQHLPWIQTVIVKVRHALTPEQKRGTILVGDKPSRRIREHGVWYAIDLLMNRDSSFYLDTRNLRDWLLRQMSGKSLLNTFAYTGSLGVAAQAAGAKKVLQLDRTRSFLNLAKDSYSLNGFPIERRNFITDDFWRRISRLKQEQARFDCVLIDPPFFSKSTNGTVDLATDYSRLINKVRPLIHDGGSLIAINNALFVSGKEYMSTLQSLCTDDCLSLSEIIPIPDDCIGLSSATQTNPITDPAPFNYSTKIAVLKIKRKRIP